MAKQTMQELYEGIKLAKEKEAYGKKWDWWINSGRHYRCEQSELCQSGKCPLYQVTCSGCEPEHTRHCTAKICNGTCYDPGIGDTGFGVLGYCLSDRCPNMPEEFVQRDAEQLQTWSVDELIDRIKPTKALDRNTYYIPVIQPYGKLAPGEIVRNKEAWCSLERADGLCMIPANQIPMATQPIQNVFEVDPEKVHIKKVDLRPYLGVQDDTEIMLNFRVQDLLLSHYWERFVFENENGLKSIFENLKELDIDYCVSVNFSVYDGHTLYHNYYNVLRTLLSFVELQKYFGPNVVLELNTNPFSRNVDDTWMKIVREGKIKTVHHNFQLNLEGELEWATLRHELNKNLEAEEIILGGVGSIKQIIKYRNIMRDQRIYTSTTRAYLSTVLKEHASGIRWKKQFPGDSPEKELERALYYRDLFYENLDYFNKTYSKIL